MNSSVGRTGCRLCGWRTLSVRVTVLRLIERKGDSPSAILELADHQADEAGASAASLQAQERTQRGDDSLDRMVDENACQQRPAVVTSSLVMKTMKPHG